MVTAGYRNSTLPAISSGDNRSCISTSSRSNSPMDFRLLSAIDGASVRRAFSMNPEKVSVMSYQNAIRGSSECEVHRIVSTE